MRTWTKWFSAFGSCVALVLVGCDSGAQGGKFAVSSMTSVRTTSPSGQFVIFRGGPPHDPTARGNSQPLLCVLVVTPAGGRSNQQQHDQDGATVSNYEWSWDTAAGKQILDLKWDRQNDVVSAGGPTFDRAKGNGFVLAVAAGGGTNLTQVGTIVTASDDAGAFRQFQAALPAGSPFSGIAVVP